MTHGSQPPHHARARFEELVRAYGRLVRGVVTRTAGTRAATLADDVEQEVLLALWKQVQAGRDIVNPAAYLYQAAARETVRMVRKLRQTEHADVATIDVPATLETDAVTRLQALAVEARVREALQALPEARRVAVEAHLADLTFEDIMSMTGWSYNRTRNLVSRGMADLRQRLGDLEE